MLKLRIRNHGRLGGGFSKTGSFQKSPNIPLSAAAHLPNQHRGGCGAEFILLRARLLSIAPWHFFVSAHGFLLDGPVEQWSVCPGFFFGQYKVLHISHDMGTGCNGHVDCVPNQLMACRIWSNSYVQNRQQIFAKSTFGTRFCSHETVGIDVCSWRFSSTKIFLKFEQCWIHPGWLFYQAASWGRHPKGCQWTAKHKCLKRGAYLFVCLIVTMVHEIPWMYMGCLSMYIYIYL